MIVAEGGDVGGLLWTGRCVLRLPAMPPVKSPLRASRLYPYPSLRRRIFAWLNVDRSPRCATYPLCGMGEVFASAVISTARSVLQTTCINRIPRANGDHRPAPVKEEPIGIVQSTLQIGDPRHAERTGSGL